METWKNLQKGFTANECLSGTYVDADVWHVCTNVARLSITNRKSRPTL
nr:hypothetical protein [Limosilactobacillus fermentum]